MRDRVLIIEAENNKKWEVYVMQFPVVFEPHRSLTPFECLDKLEEEIKLLSLAIKDKRKELKKLEKEGVKYYVTEVISENEEFIFKQKEIRYVKINNRYKVFDDWGYKKNSFYYKDSLPENKWKIKIEDNITIYRKESIKPLSKEQIYNELKTFI